jgi:hypothetical protein
MSDDSDALLASSTVDNASSLNDDSLCDDVSLSDSDVDDSSIDSTIVSTLDDSTADDSSINDSSYDDSSSDESSLSNSSIDDLPALDKRDSRRRLAQKVAVVAAFVILCQRKRSTRHKAPLITRSPAKTRIRVDPREILLSGINDGYLKNEYRMSKESLFQLHSLLQQNLHGSQNRRRSDSITSLAKVMTLPVFTE